MNELSGEGTHIHFLQIIIKGREGFRFRQCRHGRRQNSFPRDKIQVRFQVETDVIKN